MANKDPEKLKKYMREYYKSHPVCRVEAAARTRVWRARNPELARKRGRTNNARVRDKVFLKLGNKCSNPRCQWVNEDKTNGCTDKRCLQVDHVFGGGSKEHKKIGSRQIYRKVLAEDLGNYQLLCANCNWIKRYLNNETVGF